MKKIPTLFERVYENHKVIGITPQITSGCEDAFLYGTATEKIDGSCCAIINGKLYKRYDAKKGKKPPAGAIPCQDKPDEITGHYPHWVMCDPCNAADKWFIEAYKNFLVEKDIDDYENLNGTYEAIGEHFQGNPYNLESDILEKHGIRVIDDVTRTFEGVRQYLKAHNIEGIVFWLDDKPVCKIKRSDFGFEWGVKK